MSRWKAFDDKKREETRDRWSTYFGGPIRRLVVPSPLILQHRDLILVIKMNDHHRLDNFLLLGQFDRILLRLTVNDPTG